jgi:hypothetical protein
MVYVHTAVCEFMPSECNKSSVPAVTKWMLARRFPTFRFNSPCDRRRRLARTYVCGCGQAPSSRRAAYSKEPVNRHVARRAVRTRTLILDDSSPRPKQCPPATSGGYALQLSASGNRCSDGSRLCGDRAKSKDSRDFPVACYRLFTKSEAIKYLDWIKEPV